MNRKIALLIACVLVPFGVAIYIGGCVSAEALDAGGSGTDDTGGSGSDDTGSGCTQGQLGCACKDGDVCDDGLECQGGTCVKKAEDDAGVAEDAGQAGDTGTITDAGTETDTGTVTDTGTSTDAGTVTDTGVAVDGGTQQDSGTTADAGSSDWPPTTPWFAGTTCNLPACNANAAETINVTGTWTEDLTTDSHTCNKLLETFDPRMKPGNVVTSDTAYIQKGECLYSDQVGGTVNGVIKGHTAITCSVEPPQQGVTIVATGVITFNGNSATGEITGHLSGVPLAPKECEVKYTTAQTKK